MTLELATSSNRGLVTRSEKYIRHFRYLIVQFDIMVHWYLKEQESYLTEVLKRDLDQRSPTHLPVELTQHQGGLTMKAKA